MSEFTNNSIDSTLSNSTMDSLKNNSNKISFKSLADLTAHHLQKSSNLIDNTNSNEKSFSSKTNFVIPKLSIQNENCNDSQLDVCAIQKHIDYSMDSLEKSLSSVFASSKNYTDTNIKNDSQNIELKKDTILNENGTRTSSPDSWMIDLNSALKESTSLVSSNQNYAKSKILEDDYNIISSTNLKTFNQNDEIPCDILPTTLNLSCLRYVKLPYTKKNVSLFGRTLCRTWKLKKPILKSQDHHEKLKRFGFSVPYTRT